MATANAKKLERLDISNGAAVDQINVQIPKCSFIHLVHPQLNFDLKAILHDYEGMNIKNGDLEITDSQDRLQYGKIKSQKKDVVVKKLLDVENLIYVSEDEARSVIQKLVKLNDPKLVPVYGMFLDEKNCIQVVTGKNE